MHIVFATHHQFVQDRFSRVRLRLRGELAGSRKNTPLLTPSANLMLSGVMASRKAGRSGQSVQSRPSTQKRRDGSPWHKITDAFLSFLIIGGIAVGSILLVPSLYYLVFPADVIEVEATDAGTAFGGSYEQGALEVIEEEKYQPPQDATLPMGEWIVIPRIGVRSELQPTENAEEALETGMWLVPDFGRAGDTELPMIVAAHRFGWEWWWQSDYWKYHSFYNLPETEPGDRIEIISDQRKWVYEIYAGEEGEQISDYEADLILYTCKFLKSPLRHFRYARLIDPTMDTQK